AASAVQGTPISAKFEIEVDGLQLSVYTMKGDAFSEVIVDHETGRLEKTIPITKGQDFAEAQAQRSVMAQAKRSLQEITAKAVTANKGYRAVSVMPGRQDGRPVASILLTNGWEWKNSREFLD